MAAVIKEEEIAALIAEQKPLPDNYKSKLQLKSKNGFKRSELEVTGAHGNKFMVIMRQSEINVIDFSVILGFCPANSNNLFRLRRYNGKSHEHRNGYEKDRFYDFHIHSATERYQVAEGKDEDHYAQPTNRYVDIHGALECLFQDCAFKKPNDNQMNLL
jgi:hypothetical protein